MPILNSCCCCCTTRTGTLTLGILSLISSILSIVAIIFVLVTWDEIKRDLKKEYPADAEDLDKLFEVAFIALIVLAILLFFVMITASMLIHGVRKMRAGLLLPYLVLTVIGLVTSLALDISIMVSGKQLVFGIIHIITNTLLGIYFFLVVLSHYQELKDRSGRISVPTDSKQF